MARRDPHTRDLFETHAPVRVPAEAGAALAGLSNRIARALSRALKECPDSRELIAGRVAELLDRPTFSKAMLDAYTAESRESHRIPADCFAAVAIAARAPWLLGVLAEECDCVVVEGAEARALERGRIREQIEALERREARLAKEAGR
jgi:hypothetical protein